MAIVTSVSIGTSNKVSVDYQSQEVSVSLTFELERGDTDLQAFVFDKAAEVERAHSSVWRRIRELRTEQKAREAAAEPEATPPRRRGNGSKPQESAPAAQQAGTPEATPPDTVDTDPFADDEQPAPADQAATGAALATSAPPLEDAASLPQQRAVLSLANRAGMSDQTLASLLREHAGKSVVEQLTRQEAARLLVEMQRRQQPVPARVGT